MSSSGYLVAPSQDPSSQDPSQENLWTETWKRLDRFLPDLRKELDMDEPKEKEKEKPVMVGQKEEPQIAHAATS